MFHRVSSTIGIGIILVALTAALPRALAAKFADGTASWNTTTGMTVTFTPATALAAGDRIVVTFPQEVTMNTGFLLYFPGDEPVRIGGAAAGFVRAAADRSITVTVGSSLPAGTGAVLTFDKRILTAYNATVYAQQSVAINTTTATNAPKDYGVALLTNANATDVTATVPLFVTMKTDDTAIDLGTLSTASVAEAVQTYTVATNNDTGATLAIRADGPLDTAAGETIDAVVDGAVTAGDEEYGVAVTTAGLVRSTPFAAGDAPLPTTVATLATATGPLNDATLTLAYRAAIDGTTAAGVYAQVVTVTVATNA